MTEREEWEFISYLRNCTDAQVLGVWRKERDATLRDPSRREYRLLAAAEWTRRGKTPEDIE